MDFRYAPPPPPSPSSSNPHRPSPQQQPIPPPPPGAYYSGQFQYPSPSPPPPQWGPQPSHSDHHLHLPPPPHHYAAGPSQPMTYSSNPYCFPPRPHYPPVNQEWSNASRGHLGFDYSAQNKNDDDWAARAKAWAASKTVTDEQHHHSQLPPANRPEEINYQDQYSQNVDPPYQEFQQHALPPSNYQQYSSFAPQPRPPANHLQEKSSFSSGYASNGQFLYSARDGNVRDSAAYPHQETTPKSLSVHQQEVPSSYSSVAGKDGSRDMNGNFYQQSHTPYTSASQHQVQPSLSSNDRPFSIEQQPRYAFNNTSVEPPTDLSNQPLDIGLRYGHDYGPFEQSDPPGIPFTSLPPVHSTGQQADPSVGVPSPASMHSTPLFGGISNTTFPIGTSNVFHGDTYGTPGFLDRPKKASVPNWLREEIIKKKAVIGSSAQELSRHDTEFNEDEEIMDQSLGKGDQMDGKSMESSRSKEEDDDDDDEDDVELARTAAMNAEIKRLLTEVLLKVTDELFDEIATKVLDEDELNVEVERKAIASSDTLATVITPKSSAKVLIPAKAKGIDSPGDVLGLGDYASDDDEEEEKEVQKSSIPSFNSSKPAVHQGENGSSLKNLLEEKRDSHEMAMGNDNTREEKIIPGSVDFKKSKHSVTNGLNTENSLPDDSQGKIPRNEQDKIHMKVDEKSRVHDEKYAKRAKKEQNGSKEKIKERDSGKQVSKAEIKDDKKDIDRDRRSREKEDNRKLERGKDDKNEWSKYKPVGDSSKHKPRHRSPSPGDRGRSNKDRHAHRSSDSSSSDSRRNVRSRRRDLSPSPVKSRRQVSRFRSPPSKHSHRRHSNYSSLESTRERRRSRSRSRRG